MKYLFFDIECADGVHICEFGYVLTDQDFNVIQKEDILINPECQFLLDNSRGRRKISLNYSEVSYYKSPNFPKVYDKIKSLLTEKDQIIIGHSVHNDAQFIKTACTRYKEPFIDYTFYDSQIFYSEFSNVKEQISLTNASLNLNTEVSDKVHSGDEDALMTKDIVQKMCEELNCTLPELIEMCPDAEGKSEGGKIHSKYIDAVDYLNFDPDKIHQTSTKQKKHLIYALCRNLDNFNTKSDILKDKIVAISENYELMRFKETLALIEEIYSHGGSYTAVVNNADFFVKWDAFDEEGEPLKCNRYNKAIDRIQKDGRFIKILPIDLFLKKLGLTEEDLYLKDLPSKEYFRKKSEDDKSELTKKEVMTSNPFEELLRKKGLI